MSTVSDGVVLLDFGKTTFYFDQFVQDDDVCLFGIDADWAGFTTDEFRNVIVDVIWNGDFHAIRSSLNAVGCF